MLKIYRSLFFKLEEIGDRYCVYKSLNCLLADLSGERGDLDFLLHGDYLADFDRIVRGVGFRRVKKSCDFPRYYLSRDRMTGRMVMLDVDVDIRLGHKPNRPIRFTPAFDQLDIGHVEVDGQVIRVLGDSDYLPLMLLMRITAKTPKTGDFREVKQLNVRCEERLLNESYFGRLLAAIDTSILPSLAEVTSWEELQRLYKNNILNHIAGGLVRRRCQVLIVDCVAYVKEVMRKFGRMLGRPAYPVHKGAIVAFVGVDGSGKTSAVKRVLNDQFFRATGVKRIYFGANEYMIPGLVRLHQALGKIPVARVTRHVVGLLLLVDRQLRLLKALYYRSMGVVVLCDRYYYDDELSRNHIHQRINAQDGVAWLDRLKLVCLPRMVVKPDLTFYLDVSPAVAYKRKQDYSFETMQKVNAAYRELMANRREVTFIDADEPEDRVQMEIVSRLKVLVDENCIAQ